MNLIGYSVIILYNTNSGCNANLIVSSYYISKENILYDLVKFSIRIYIYLSFKEEVSSVRTSVCNIQYVFYHGMVFLSCL